MAVLLIPGSTATDSRSEDRGFNRKDQESIIRCNNGDRVLGIQD